MSKEQAIRELVEKAIEDAMDVGAFSGLLSTPAKQRARHDHEKSKAALLTAIARLEAKAATAKAECDARREHDSPHSGLMAFRAIVEARAATDEAWKKPENKQQ